MRSSRKFFYLKKFYWPSHLHTNEIDKIFSELIRIILSSVCIYLFIHSKNEPYWNYGIRKVDERFLALKHLWFFHHKINIKLKFQSKLILFLFLFSVFRLNLVLLSVVNLNAFPWLWKSSRLLLHFRLIRTTTKLLIFQPLYNRASVHSI